MGLSKVKIGLPSRHKNVHNLSHDVNTTAQFGFVQPTNCIEVTPDDTITIKTKSFCRLMPMYAPTFGRVFVKHYHRYVPIVDIFKNFEALLSGTEIAPTGHASYIPSSLPKVTIQDLTFMVLQFSRATLYTYNHSTKNVTIDTSSAPQKWLPYVDEEHRFCNPDNLVFYDGNVQWMQTNDNSIGFESADFIVETSSGASSSGICCFQLNDKGRNLRKVLLGLGYQLDPSNKMEVSVGPLFAFYRMYFDEFEVQRNKNWTMTAASRILDKFYQYGTVDLSSRLRWNNDYGQDWRVFLEDLVHAFYYDSPDYFTANIPTPSVNEIGHAPAQSSPVALVEDNRAVAASTQPTFANNIVSLKVAQKLYSIVNKQSVFGANVAKYLESVYGSEALHTHDTYKVGQSQFMCNISDVMSQADTASGSQGSLLGEYAGKGIGSDESKTFKQTFKEFGYLVSFMVVVPDSSYIQGVNRNNTHLSRYHFFNPEFDAVGFQMTLKGEYVGSRDIVKFEQVSGDYHNEGFGFLPRYSEYKCAPHAVANGNLTLRSTRADMLPYVLDRWFTTQDCSYQLAGSQPGGISNFEFKDGYIPTVVNPYMRKIGISGAMGNYNRIFAYVGRSVIGVDLNSFSLEQVDNFIIHNVFEVKRISRMKPIAESFDTDGEGGATMSVEHE